MSPRTTALLVVVGAAAAVGSQALLWTSTGRLSAMVIGALLGVAAAVALTPLTMLAAARVMARRSVAPGALAGRIIGDDSSRWSVVAAAITAVVALALTTFIMASATVSAQLALSGSRLPAGSALLEVENAERKAIPAAVQKEFESRISASAPVSLTERQAVVKDVGVVWFFNSPADAERVLGPLPESASETLNRGGLLTVGSVQSASVTVVIDQDREVTMPVASIKPSADRRYRLGAGFAVISRVAPEIRAAQVLGRYNLYLGLASSQDAAAASFVAQTGQDAFEIDAYRPPGVFSLPLWTCVALVGFGLLMTPVLAGALRREAIALRPVAATLGAVGLPPNWIRSVFGMIGVMLLVPSVLSALVAATVSVGVLQFIYPTVFDLAGVPWWMVLVFLAAMCIAVSVGIGSALHRLRRQESRVVI